MKFMLSVAAVFVAATSLSVGPAGAASPNIAFSDASVSPATSTGPCPQTFTFKTTISATNFAPTALKQIQYKWTRSDGADSPTITATPNASGAIVIPASTTWELGAQGSFWQAVAIVYPQNVTGPKLSFTNSCGTNAPATRGPRPHERPSAVDCVSFDPKNLSAAKQGADYLLASGTEWMNRFASLDDAKNAELAAAHYDRQCFVGRNNTRADRAAYIMEYYEGSGPGGAWPSPEDCISYNPSNLEIAERNGSFYLDEGANISMVQLATFADAERALLVGRAHAKQCFVGRNNGQTGDARYGHIMSYYK